MPQERSRSTSMRPLSHGVGWRLQRWISGAAIFPEMTTLKRSVLTAITAPVFAGVALAPAVANSPPAAQREQPSASAPLFKHRVTFRSGDLTLEGYLFKPEGKGPFATIVWNHGSEKDPGGRVQFDSAGTVFLQAGYAMFAPVRRGHGNSQGDYIVDVTDAAFKSGGVAGRNQTAVRLLETEQVADQLAALTYLKSLSWVDTTRLAVAGCSYGGIQTLLGAEANVGYRAAFSISPAGLSWNGNPLLQRRLVEAVGKIRVPVMLIQPPKDTSLEPSRVLGAEFKRLGKTYTGKIYPSDLPPDLQVHCFGGAKGMHVWADDARAFFKPILK